MLAPYKTNLPIPAFVTAKAEPPPSLITPEIELVLELVMLNVPASELILESEAKVINPP